MGCRCAERAAGLLGRLGFRGASLLVYQGKHGNAVIQRAALPGHHVRLAVFGLLSRWLLGRSDVPRSRAQASALALAHAGHARVEYDRAGDATLLNTADFPGAKVFIVWGPALAAFASLEEASPTFLRVLRTPVPGEPEPGYRRFAHRLLPGLREEPR